MSPGERDDIFRRWLASQQGLMLKVARSFSAGREDREDLLQEILMQLWRSIPSFAGKSEESTWIYKVALNTAVTWKRGAGRRRRSLSLLDSDFDPRETATSAGDAEQRETLERLYDAIRKLPKIERSLILLHLDGRDYRQMSEIMGISETNVGARLTRARKRLSELMKGDNHGD